MSVSSLGSSTGLYQWLQQLAANCQATATGQAKAATVGQDSDGDSDGSSASTATGSVSGHHHHGGHGLTNKLESAITSALNSSSSTSDPNQVIQDAIKNLFSPNGNGPTANGAAPDKPNDGDDNAPSAAGQDTTQGASQFAQQQAAFVQLLQSHGVDPAQFQKDLQTALQNSQGGQPNFSQIFKSFPPGSVVDTTA